MKLIECPLNGVRSVQEFVCGGAVTREPLPDAPAKAWAEYVFADDNSRGTVDEWWCHVASAYWFIVRRNRSTNAVTATYTIDQYFAESTGQEKK